MMIEAKTHLFFDIDQVLSCNDPHTEEDVAYFLDQGAIISAVKTHYVFPGVIELMKLLSQTKGVRFSFFSSGHSDRNLPFVKNLLTRALGVQGYTSIEKEVLVLSREHLSSSDTGEKSDHQKIFGFFPGNKQKDISQFLRDDEKLENAVIVEDDKTYIAPMQGKNLLAMRACNGSDFRVSSEQHKDGHESKIWHKANHIYYLTGLIFHAIETAAQEKKPVSEVLFGVQYKKISREDDLHPAEYELDYDVIGKRDDLFLYGLEKLRVVNPNLEFITPKHYLQSAAAARTEEQQLLIDRALENNANDCCIM